MKDVIAFHRARFMRMLNDLQLDPASLLAGRGFALRDDVSGRLLTPPLNNQTLAEGLVSAVKLAAWSMSDEAEP